MAYTTIDKPDLYFNTVLYTGNGSTQSITGVGFAGDFFWFKERSVAGNNQILDRVRSSFTKNLITNTTDSEGTTSTYITSVNSDGFDLGVNNAINQSGVTNVAWSWLADNTTGSSNNDGSITSTVSANTTSGFSIVSYTGTGSAGTVGHGLGTTPAMIIVKNRDAVTNWIVGHKSLGLSNGVILLNSNSASTTDSTVWNNTSPTSSVFSVGANGGSYGTTTTSNNFIAYCFAEKKGFSKFGSFSGNANADGTFVYTGFKPAFIIEKLSSGLASWLMFDNKRDGINGSNNYLYTNETNSESTTQLIDILSNGFKHRHAGGANASGTSIYMAFAENPLVGTNNIPATAR